MLISMLHSQLWVLHQYFFSHFSLQIHPSLFPSVYDNQVNRLLLINTDIKIKKWWENVNEKKWKLTFDFPLCLFIQRSLVPSDEGSRNNKIYHSEVDFCAFKVTCEASERLFHSPQLCLQQGTAAAGTTFHKRKTQRRTQQSFSHSGTSAERSGKF